MKTIRASSLLYSLLASTLLAGCAGMDNYSDPYYGGRPSGQGQPYGGGGYYGSGPSYGDSYYDRRERERLEEERRRLERERERLERERDRQDAYRPPPVSRPPVQYDRCPAGFTPSEDKCRPEERKHGCKDIRMPSGLGCVKR